MNICTLSKNSDIEIKRTGLNSYSVFIDRWTIDPGDLIRPTGWTEPNNMSGLTWMRVRWLLDEVQGLGVKVPAFAKDYFDFHTFWGRVRCNLKALFQ